MTSSFDHLMMMRPEGMRLLPSRHLDPRLEKDTFPGGVNLTARARNIARIDDSTIKVWVHKQQNVIVGSTFALWRLRAEVAGKDELVPRMSRHPAAMEWYSRHGVEKPDAR